jgi:GTP-binding protein
MSPSVRSASFLMSSPSLALLPRDEICEIAIFGRSNAGKSTFINRLLHHKKLARTGARPGLTREVVAFEITLVRNAGEDLKLRLMDLPGFGFAKAPKSGQEAIHKLIAEYLTHRENLKVVVLLNDCRREPQADELLVRDLALERGAHLLVILSKLDKLSRSQQIQRAGKIAESYGLESEDLLSSGNDFSIEPVWERIAGLV